MTRALLIMGPTASGKSALALALALAQALAGEIVNADSMQVYRDLRVLTARPSGEEEAQAPHHLYGCIDAGERYSVGAWARAVQPVLGDIARRGKRAIVVGGTGLYFMALTEGLAEIPPVPGEVRAALQERLAREGAPALHRRLADCDPVMAKRLSPNDAPRLLRALEVMEATQLSLSVWIERSPPVLAPDAWRGVALTPPREWLRPRIESRFAAMLESGAMEEARQLFDRGLDAALPCMKAHGMPWMCAHFRGEMGLDEVTTLSVRDTRRYAKRQATWIRGQMPAWEQITETDLRARLAHFT